MSVDARTGSPELVAVVVMSSGGRTKKNKQNQPGQKPKLKPELVIELNQITKNQKPKPMITRTATRYYYIGIFRAGCGFDFGVGCGSGNII